MNTQKKVKAKLKKNLLQQYRPGRRQFVQRNAGKSGPVERFNMNE